LPGLIWRPISRDDLAAVVDLARACLRVDGGLPFLFMPEVLQGRFFPDTPGAGIGAFDAGQRLGACVTVHLDEDGATQRATLTGYVRPDLRRRGLGAYLMRWGQTQAQTLFTEPAVDQRVLRIATESLTEPAHLLYLAHGYAPESEDWIMRRDLRLPLPAQPLPEGVTLATWAPETAGQFFQAYHAAFLERPGFPNPSAEQWIDGVNGNDLVTEWTLLAREGDQPLGFVIGALGDLTASPPDGYVVQIGVVPEARRRGLASALIVEALRRMQAAGAPSADLQVHTNNPGAIQAYAGLGFVTIARRVRYERPAEQ
jgi:ribosomal protein S18 acetylase RimI-like enzyme